MEGKGSFDIPSPTHKEAPERKKDPTVCVFTYFGGVVVKRTTGPQLHNNIGEAEGNLNPYLPHLCLYSQFSFSLGVIEFQLLGFTTCNVVVVDGGLSVGGRGLCRFSHLLC